MLKVWRKVCISNIVHKHMMVSGKGMNYFCWHENDCIDCSIEPWRSIVKVEPWNMIRPCRNLQLQIVWNWLGVLVLFGRLTAIGSIYLLKTTKVSGNTERGSWTVIFLLFTFFLCLGLCLWRFLKQEHISEAVWGISVFIFGGVVTMDRTCLFLKCTQIPSH